MFPDAARLRRLLEYLSIHPLSIVMSLDEAQIVNSAAGNTLTQESLSKIDRIRKAVYNYKNYNQIGLFEFRVGLILMDQGWFSEAAESFRKAANLWSFLPERPNICLANFANGVAHHRNGRFDLAAQTYLEVQEQLVRIQEDVNAPSSIAQVRKYQDFVKDLTAQLGEAQKTVSRDMSHDPSPRIHPSLQPDASRASSPQLLKVDQGILQSNIQRHFNTAELQALCFELKIDFNALDGVGMANKARELVAYCDRNRRMSSFLQELSKRKPSVPWEENILHPPAEEVVEEEPVRAADKSENVVEGQFEELESAEKGLEFIRTELGKIQFPEEAERVRPTPQRMVIVNVELSGNFSQFSLEEQNHFVHFISKITDIDANQITLLEVMAGSIKVTLEMPEGSARQLIGMLLEKNPILTNFRILKVELGELVGPPPAGRLAASAGSDLLQKVIPIKLEQFIFLYFNDKELRELYYGVNVDYDSLPGRGKREKAAEIVAFCSRHHKFQQLARLCWDKRPTVFVKAFSDS